jgi:fibronectin type 3 domain-containing protein
MQGFTVGHSRVAAGVCAGFVSSLLTTVLLGFSPAAALTTGVAFSADNLSTWQTDADGVVWAVGASHGKVVAGGTFSSLVPPAGGSGSPVALTGLAILDGETGAPDVCQLPVALPGGTPTVRGITTSADGDTVYVAGDFTSIGGQPVGRLAAIDVVSCSVKSFRVPGISAMVRSVAVRGNVLYFGGDFTVVNTQPRQRFAAVNATTGAVLPWTANVDAPGRAVGVSPDGTKVAIGGDFFNVNGAASHSIAVVDGTTGANLRTYTNGFIPNTSMTHTIWSGQDRFYIGNEGTGGGVFDGRLAISWTTLDEVWRDNCLGATQAVMEYQGTLYSASHAHNCDATAFQDGKRNYLMAQDAATAKLLAWDPRANDGINEHIGPRALTTVVGRTTGKTYLWVGGEFTQINGAAQQGLTRFGPDDTAAPPTPTVVAEATSEGAIQVRWRSVVDPDDSEVTYNVYRNGASTPIWTGTASSVWWKRPQVTFVDNTVVPGQTYSYRVRASDPVPNTGNLSSAVSATATAPTATYASTVRADRPSLYWNSTRSASSPTWVQEVGAVTSDARRINGLTPAINATAAAPGSSTDSPVAGDLSGSMSFDGSDDYIWSDEYVPGPDVYSIETWIKTTTTRGGQIVNYGNGRPRTDTGTRRASSSYDRMLYMENTGQVRFGTGGQTVRSSQALNNGQWHHLVATQGPGGMALYVDGIRVGTNALTTSASYNGVWHLGGDNLSGWPSRPTSTFFAGLIDETAIYPTVLNRRTIGAHAVAAGRAPAVNPRPTDTYGGAVFDDDPELYWRLADSSGTTARDSSYFGFMPGRYQNNVSLGAAGIRPGNAAVTLPGSTNGTVATQTAVVPPGVFSGEVWFRTTTTRGGKLLGFENTQTGNGASYDKNLYMTNAGRLVFGTSASGVQTISSPGSYNNNAWHHAVVVLDGAGQKLYVDGNLVASSNVSSSQSFTGYWRVGGGNLSSWPSTPTSGFFAGSVDEAAIYHATLPRSTVLRHYALGVGDVQPPSVPTNVTATSTAGVATVAWNASTDNTGVDGYRIYRGTSAGFVPGSSNLVGTTTATTFSEPLPAGDFYYQVVAFDAVPNSSSPSSAAAVTVPDAVGPSTPANVTATSAGPGAVTVTWTDSTDNVAVTGYSIYRGTSAGFAPSPANKVGVSGSSPTFGDSSVPRGSYFYKVIANDAAGNTSLESAAAAVTVPDYVAPSAPTNVTATPSGQQVSLTWNASTDDLAVAGYRVYRGTTAAFAVGPASLVGQAASTSFTDSPPISGTYHYKVVATDAAGNASDPSTAAQASVTVPDTTAPAAPTNLSTSVSGGSVTVGWSAATDDVGVTGYSVYRGTTAGFTADAGSRIAQDVTTLTYTDSGRPAGTFYYKVEAKDAAGNQSVASAPVSATVAATTVTVQPIEDASARSGQPTTNVGTENQISAVGGGTPVEAFLKFNLPTPPPGTVLSGVSLALRTSTDPSAASVDSFDIHVSTGAWTETGVTWNNRPTGVADKFGTLTGTTALNTVYPVTGDPAALRGLGGSPVTLRISGAAGAGSDNLRVWSREASASLRPALTLTYSPQGDTTPPSTPSASTQVDGSAVTVTWTGSTDDVGVTGYSVYRGTTPGFASDASSRIAQGLTGLSYTDPGRPVGTYYYKVQARDAVGNSSAPSEAAQANVVDQSKPSAPGSVVASSSGPGAVTVTWAASTDDVGVTGYSVFRGAAPGFTADASSRVAQDLTTLTYSDSDRPAGTSYYKVVARDAAGNASNASDPAAVTVPDYIAPSSPSGLTATVTGASVALGWTASTDDVGVTGYSVYRDSSPGFTPDDATNRIADVTDVSYTDSSRPAGTFYYKVRARDGAGNVSAAPAAAEAIVADSTAPTAPGNVQASSSGPGTVAVTWTASTDNVGVVGYSVYRGSTAGFDADASHRVAQDLTVLSYTDTNVARGDHFYKVVAKDAANNVSNASDPAAVTVPDTSAPSTPSGLTATVTGDSVALGWSASTDDAGVTGYSVFRGTTSGFTPDPATNRIAHDLTTLAYTDSGRPAGTYYYKVQAVDAAGNLSNPSAEAQATIAGADTGPPSTPTNLTASVSGATVTVSWSAATDDIGVTGYSVYRGTIPGFTADSTSRIAQDVTGLTYGDSGRAAGTYYYKVRAQDAAGNLSPSSAAVPATVAATTTVTVQPTEDSSARSGQPTTNVGAENQVSAAGGGTPVWAFLKFNLPAAPPGTALSSATLALRTSTDPSAASVDTFDIHVTPATWTEAGLTWNNRPATVGDKFGTLTGTSATNTVYPVTGTPAALAGLTGTTVSLRISAAAGAGADNLRLWSREAAASLRPALTLTYSTAPDATAPSSPSGLVATVTGDAVGLTWSASTDDVGVTGYSVFRGTTAGFIPDAGARIAQGVTDLSYADSARPAGTWFYKVRARDAAGNVSDPSAAAEASVASADTSAPTAPGNVQASSTGPGAVTVTWDASTDDVGVTGYSVFRGTTSDFTTDADSWVAQDLTSSTYTDTNVSTGHYFYKVVAKDAVGNASNDSLPFPVTVPDWVAPTSPSALTATVTGDSVGLGWVAAADDVGVVGYSVFRGATADFAADADSRIAQDVTDTSYTDPGRPVGTFYYKVRARDAAGNVSDASVEAHATVSAPDTGPPSAPGNVQASSSGPGSVLVTWDASTDDVAVTGYSVYRGATSGFTADASSRVGEDVTTPTFHDTSVPRGDWFYKVVARDAVGNASNASDAAPVTVPDWVVPSAPTDLAATVSGDAVALAWSASADDVGVTGYSLFRGTTPGFTPDADARIAQDLSDTAYTDSARPAGTWYYKVRARDAAGNVSDPSTPAEAIIADTSAPSAPANVQASSTAPGSVRVTWDASTDDVAVTGYSVHRGTTVGFTPDSVNRVAQDLSSPTYIDTGVPRGDYFYKVVATDAATNTSNASDPAPVTVPDWVAPSTPTDLAATVTGDSVGLSWSASTDDVGVTGYSVFRGTASGFTPDASHRIAQDVTSLTYADPGRPAGTFYYVVRAVDAAGNLSDPSAAAQAVIAGDSNPPSTPTNLTTSVSGGSVTVSWAAASDDVGVTGYSLFRGTSAGFTPSAANRIADDVTALTYTDTGRPLGTFHYKVRAKDAGGNVSAPSAAVSAVVAASTVTVQPTEDASARSGQPANNTGSENQVSSAGGSAPVWGFMKFNLPAAPPGTTLSGVTLALRTSTDPSAASVDSFDIHVAPNTWTEAGLTWNNRPTTVTDKVGTLTAPTALNTVYPVIGAPASLTGLVGTTVTLRISAAAGAGSDNLRLWSRDASASFRPALTLTYSPPGDTAAPSTPTASAQVTGSTVTVSWDASTDNVEATGYSVFRGTSPGFTPDASNRIALDLTTLTYTDSDRPAGTYYYKVQARDAAGNVSSPSSSAEATVGGP